MDEKELIECLNNLYEITHPQNREKDYFKNKYNFIKYVEKYIDLLMNYDIPNKKIDTCLYLIAYDVDTILIQALLGEHICNKIIELKKETPYEYGKHALKGGE